MELGVRVRHQTFRAIRGGEDTCNWRCPPPDQTKSPEEQATQRQTTETAYSTSKQLLLFLFPKQYSLISSVPHKPTHPSNIGSMMCQPILRWSYINPSLVDSRVLITILRLFLGPSQTQHKVTGSELYAGLEYTQLFPCTLQGRGRDQFVWRCVCVPRRYIYMMPYIQISWLYVINRASSQGQTNTTMYSTCYT